LERTAARGPRPFHLYLDTSGLVKLVLDEPGTDLTRRAVGDAYSVRASELAYPEARSAIARLHRENAIGVAAVRTLIGWLDEAWERCAFDPIVPDAEVCRRAGELAGEHSLRAYDAVQLASALHLRANYRPDPAGDIVHFLTFDERLRRAAGAEERLRVYEPPAQGRKGTDAEGGPGGRP
jgi:predicted nucleic acid-binding protein